MFALSAWLRNTLAAADHGFRFDSWLQRTFRRVGRSQAGTICARPKARGYRAEVIELESRCVPTGLQSTPITIFQPYNAALAFTPSTPGAGNAGTPIAVEGQTVVAGENLLEFEDTVGSADLTHLTAVISWSDGSTDTVTSASTSVATIVYLPSGGTTPGANFAVMTLATGAHVYGAAPAVGGNNLNYQIMVSDDGVLNSPAGSIGDSVPLNAPGGLAAADVLSPAGTSSIDTADAPSVVPGLAPFGVVNTATYGETITATASQSLLTSFSFEMDVPPSVVFRGEVYAWDGTNGHATGPDLFESAPTSTTGSGLQPVTFNIPGGVALTPGQPYVLFVTTSKDQTGPSFVTGDWAWTGGTDVYSGGSLVYFNNGANFGALTTAQWDGANSYPSSDFAFSADFGTQSPLPAQVEGTPSGSLTVAHFSDIGYPANPGSNFGVSINWGDGTPLDTTSGSVTNDGDGNLTVTSTGHTYAAGGNYNVTITLADAPPGTATATLATTIWVSEPPVIVTGGVAFTPMQGTSFSGAVATFTDPGNPVGAPLDQYAATINWGDGQSSPGIISGPVAGVFTVTGAHTYAEESGPDVPNSQPYQISVTVQHGPLPGGGLAPAPNLVVNGSFETPVVGDENSGNFASIPGWTDSSGNGIELDGDGALGTPYDGTQALELNSAGPSDISQTIPTVVGETYWLSFAFSARAGTSPADNDVHVNVDGSPVAAITLDGSALASGYDWQVYTYAITATSSSTTLEFQSLSPAGDSSGGELDDVSLVQAGIDTANVSDPPVALNQTPINLPAINEGGSTGLVTVATFTDPGGPEPASHYAATIDWGDGQTTTNAAIVYDPVNNVFDVEGCHTYLEESTNNDGGPGDIGGVYQITTTVVHELSSPTPNAVTATVLVNEAPVVIQPGGTLQLFDTGVDDTGALLPAGSVDPHYTLVSNADEFGTSAFIADPANSPNGNGTWSANSSTAQWITPQTDDNGDAVGAFDYQTSFTVSAAVAPSTIVITGDFAVDDTVEVFVNGVDSGMGASENYNSGYNSFTLNSGDATFHVGVNTIDFVVYNGAGPSGLIVDNLVGTANSGVVINKAQNTGNVIVATFVDPAGAESVSNYSATIDWGDGAPPTPATCIFYDAVDNVFDVIGNHTYDEASTNPPENGANPNGSFHVNVTVDHGGDITSRDDTTSFTVLEPPLANVQGNPNTLTPIEGNNGAYLLATFVDPGDPNGVTGDDYPGNPDGNPIEYTAAVNWGDGTAIDHNVTFVYDSVNNVFDVYGAHAYLQASAADNPGSTPYTITVQICHDDTAPPAPVTDAAIVSDPAVIATPGQTTVNGVEKQSTNTIILAAFTDPGDDGSLVSSVTVTNGGAYFDTPQVVFTGGGGSGAVGQPIMGSDPDSDFGVVIGVLITNPGIGYTSAPTITFVGGACHDPATGYVTLTPDVEPISAYSATVNWGDGATESTATSSNIYIVSAGVNQYLVLGSHTYAEGSGATPYLIQTTVDHEAAPPSNTVIIPATITDPAVDGMGNFTVTDVEGSASGLQTVATFTDPAGAASRRNPGAEYSAVINWGDGTATSDGTITYRCGAFTVQGCHTYAEDGDYTISVVLAHCGSPSVTVISTAVVSDPSVALNVSPLPFAAVEGAPSASQPVATFTDPGGAEGLVEYGATIDWGDGTGPSTGTITYADGAFTVWGAHTYATDGSYPITVTVNHGASVPSVAQTATATVTDPAVILNATPLTFSAVEGSMSDTQTVATFTDPGGPAVHQVGTIFVPNNGAYTADIVWGDGGVSLDAAVSYNFVTQTFYVVGQHDYAEEGTYSIYVTVFRGISNGVSTQTATATVADPAVIGAGGFAFSAVEGALSSVQTLATFTDPGDPTGTVESGSDYSASINWGDGSPIDTATEANGGITFNAATKTFTVLGAHDYDEAGSYPITIVLHHDVALDTTVTSSATVSDPSVILNTTSPLSITAVEGQQVAATVATFTDPGGAEPVGDYSAEIAWGDGATTPGLITLIGADSYEVSWFHTYTAGSPMGSPYQVTVTVSHGTSTPTTGVTATATVSEPSVVLNATPIAVNATEGAAFTNQAVATFTDPAGAQAEGQYSATIDWGATGTGSTIGTISFNPATQTFTVSGGFQYSEETAAGSPNQVTVTVSHGTSTPVGTVTATATIVDPAVIVTGNFAVAAQRGAAVTPQIVATFTDPGGAELLDGAPNPADYTALVLWGDATPATVGTITYDAGSQTFTVSAGGHTYTQNGNYTITVQVSHPAKVNTVTVSSFAAVVDPSVILNTPPFTFTSLVGTHITNQKVATFTDPAGAQVIAGFPVSGAYTAYIDWGDGTPADPDVTIGTITYSAGVFTVKGSHTYTEDSTTPNSGNVDGAFHIIVTVAHGNSTPLAVDTANATINDPAVLVNGNKTVSGVEGSAPASPWLLATFTDPGGAQAAANYTAQINWGDGKGFVSLSAAGAITFDTASGKFDVTDSHVYSSFGTYTVQVQVAHGNSTPVTVKDTAVIKDAPLTAGALAPPVATEAPAGSALPALAVLFHFTDANTLELASAFTATVSWGDSLTNTSADGTGTVTVVATGGGGFNVMGAHVYTEGLSHATFAVSVKDAGGAMTAAKGILVVADPSVVLNTTPLTFVSVVNVLSDVQPVATFTDPGGPDVIGNVPKSGEYTALINWGDGASQTNGVITYNSATHTFTVSGTHRYASQTGNPYHISVTVAHGSAAPATGVTATTTVSPAKVNQTISFPTPTAGYSPSASTYSIQVVLGAAASSGLPVTYSVKSTALVAGSGAGSITTSISGHTLTITIRAATTANFNIVIEASQAGDLNYNAATAVQKTLVLTDSKRGSAG